MRSTTRRAFKLDLSNLHALRTVRAVVAVLGILLVGNSVALADGAPLDPVKLKVQLSQRGVGNGIWVKEMNGKTVKGTLTGIHDDSLDITPKKASQMQTIQYSQITELENTGMTTDSKTLIGIGVGAVLTIAIVMALVRVGGKAIIPH